MVAAGQIPASANAALMCPITSEARTGGDPTARVLAVKSWYARFVSLFCWILLTCLETAVLIF